VEDGEYAFTGAVIDSFTDKKIPEPHHVFVGPNADEKSFLLRRPSASERFGRNGHGEKTILVGMYYGVVAHPLK
jgi:hypothetical protein